VLVTSRGRPVARLLAVAGAADEKPTAAELELRLRRIPGALAAKGGKPRGSARPIVVGRGQRTLAELVLRDRR
jgi:antitoxin (DNA-binding transcriptional repressor) of toxin-antitoxin stability system